MIIGLVGSGKSYVIDAIIVCLTIVVSDKEFLYFRIAAFNVVQNSHSLLQLQIRAKKNGPLISTALSKLQDDLNGIKC
jgi:predicted ATP-binding protein involved in virulence